MKKELVYTADRNSTLTLEELSKFLADANQVGISYYHRPVVEVRPSTGRTDRKGGIIKITGTVSR